MTNHIKKVLKSHGFSSKEYTDNKGEKFVGWSKDKKELMAKKMKRKGLEKYLDNFIKHGEKRSDENIWKYARLNPDSDKRIF